MKQLSVIEKKQVLLPRNLTKVSILLVILLVVSTLASLAFGSRMISVTDLMDGLFHPSVESHEANVVRQRIVRTIFCFMCGAALGVSGALMQSVTRNPISTLFLLSTMASFSLLIGFAPLK